MINFCPCQGISQKIFLTYPNTKTVSLFGCGERYSIFLQFLVFGQTSGMVLWNSLTSLKALV